MQALTIENLANFEKIPPPMIKTSNFAFAFKILPFEEKTAINSVYTFFSYIDSIVDEGLNDNFSIKIKEERLRFWTYVINELYEDRLPSNLLFPLMFIIRRFSIPKQYFLTLIDGCKRDLFQKRYETFQDLKDYCYSVASVVGLIVIEIFGHKYEETKNYAINLGYAFQLTNILRDIKKDKNRGYIYLPQEDLRRFNYSEEELFTEVYNDNFVDLMRFETLRTREFYHRARSMLHPDERVSIFSAEVMDEIYYRLLEKIELNRFNVFKKEIRVSSAHKLMLALKHWLSILLFIKPFARIR